MDFEVCYKKGLSGMIIWGPPLPLPGEWQGSLITGRFSLVRCSNAGTSLSSSIVNIWLLKNGSFSAKCCPGLTGGFYFTVQLTLAVVSRLAVETPPLLRSQQIKSERAVFPLILTGTGNSTPLDPRTFYYTLIKIPPQLIVNQARKYHLIYIT